MTDSAKIRDLIAKGEGLNIEFKKSYESLSRSAFESICAFLNRKGGTMLLGVNDNGSIEGVREDSVQQQLTTLARDLNNTQILSPTKRLEVEPIVIDGKTIICIQVPERLLAFIDKHTPDRFYLEGVERFSIRQLIFREMCANLLCHREYASPYPARITIYKNIVVSENWTIPQTIGRITPENVMPRSKNPTIANCFRQIGWVEDLGSGIRNMYKYCPIYVQGAYPDMEENDVFKLTIRYEKEGKIGSATPTITNTEKVLFLIRTVPKITAQQISDETLIPLRTVRRILATLTEQKIVKRMGSDKDGEWVLL